MVEKSWPWSTVAGLGDGASQLGESDSRLALALYFKIQNPASEGVSKGVLNELLVSGSASPLTVASGSAVCYGLYWSDAPVNVTVATPAVGTTGGRVVLRTNWAGTGGASLEARTRIAVKLSADGNPAIPGLTQSVGTTWEISLATFTVTTGGVITVTDARTFRRSTAMVNSGEIIDAAVTLTKLSAAVAAQLVTNGNSHDHVGGDGALIGVGGISNSAVGTNQIANDAVTPIKIPNRTRRITVPFLTWSVSFSDIEIQSGGVLFPADFDRYVQGGFVVPADYVSGGQLIVVGYPNSSGNNFVVYMRADYGAIGESAINHTVNTGVVTVAAGTVAILKSLLTLTLTNLAIGDDVGFYFGRLGSNGSDTNTNQMAIRKIYFEYTADS